MKIDKFADIALGGMNLKDTNLVSVEPEMHLVKELALHSDNRINSIVFPEKMNTREKLYEEVEKQKAYYEPFFRRLAPSLKSMRLRKQLDVFEWRVSEAEDKCSFGRVVTGEGTWEQVEIPHFGPPLGVATTYYRTNFTAGVNKDQALFIHFDGVDYMTKVYVNGAMVGMHEGFFAPFEFDITEYVADGENSLVIEVGNDYIMKRNESCHGGEMLGGDKLYAATGPGYDDPAMGWHHCPPGMGIYQQVYLESRNRCYIEDLFVRPFPKEESAELWVSVGKCDPGYEDIKVVFSVYGRNFSETVFENYEYVASTAREVGMGDTFTKAKLEADGILNDSVKLYMEKGQNLLRIPFEIPHTKIWEQNRPFLYEVQVRLFCDDVCIDGKSCSFGMRSFELDTTGKPRGDFYLNGKRIKLRGANTMGDEQQCVMKGDDEQLLTDLLLAKICNMNFLRLTQRPVQDKVYEYCDMLGLMTQTDLPLFGVLRINKFVEALRQTEEMAKIVRSHPCNIMLTYINEPFPNADNQPHRQLSRRQLMDFFDCADVVVRLQHPDCVIKHVDGDYDPPSKTLPDNHCYTCWYNGHGIDSGALHKGYWIPVNQGWNYGCGEYGAEGLDGENIMHKYYPAEWLPQSPEEEQVWTPKRILGAQTGNFYYMFYDKQHRLKDWVKASQEYQAWATKWMTEAFRRDSRMISFAIHLFIDAFPAGWMKAIMDVDRNPKPAYFAYRDALSPVMVSLRTDRFSGRRGERIPVEVWISNDLSEPLENYSCYYESGESRNLIPVAVPECSVLYAGTIEVPLDSQKDTQDVRVAVLDSKGNCVHTNSLILDVYDLPEAGGASEANVLIFREFGEYQASQVETDKKIREGFRAVFFELPPGDYEITEKTVTVKTCSMLPVNFVSSKTGHPYADGFRKNAFRNWYSSEEDMIKPILESTVSGEGINPVLISGNTDEEGNWEQAIAVGEILYGNGSVIICQLRLSEFTEHNPAAEFFYGRLIGR